FRRVLFRSHHRVHGQRAMRRGQRVLVINLAVGAAMVMIRRPVPTGQSGFHVDGFRAARNRRWLDVGFGAGRRRRFSDGGRRRNRMSASGLMAAAGREQQRRAYEDERQDSRGQPFFCFLPASIMSAACFSFSLAMRIPLLECSRMAGTSSLLMWAMSVCV